MTCQKSWKKCLPSCEPPLAWWILTIQQDIQFTSGRKTSGEILNHSVYIASHNYVICHGVGSLVRMNLTNTSHKYTFGLVSRQNIGHNIHLRFPECSSDHFWATLIRLHGEKKATVIIETLLRYMESMNWFTWYETVHWPDNDVFRWTRGLNVNIDLNY